MLWEEIDFGGGSRWVTEAVAVSPDTTLIFIASSGADCAAKLLRVSPDGISARTTTSNRVLCKGRGRDFITAAAVRGGLLESSGPPNIATAFQSGTVAVWVPERANGTVVFEVVRAHVSRISCVEWIPHCPTVMVSGGSDGRVKAHDIRCSPTSRPAFETASSCRAIRDIAITPPTHPPLLAAALDTGSLLLFDLRNVSKPLRTPPCAVPQARGATTDNNVIRSHNAATNAHCDGANVGAQCVEWGMFRGGLTLASGGMDRCVKVWSAKPRTAPLAGEGSFRLDAARSLDGASNSSAGSEFALGQLTQVSYPGALRRCRWLTGVDSVCPGAPSSLLATIWECPTTRQASDVCLRDPNQPDIPYASINWPPRPPPRGREGAGACFDDRVVDIAWSPDLVGGLIMVSSRAMAALPMVKVKPFQHAPVDVFMCPAAPRELSFFAEDVTPPPAPAVAVSAPAPAGPASRSTTSHSAPQPPVKQNVLSSLFSKFRKSKQPSVVHAHQPAARPIDREPVHQEATAPVCRSTTAAFVRFVADPSAMVYSPMWSRLPPCMHVRSIGFGQILSVFKELLEALASHRSSQSYDDFSEWRISACFRIARIYGHDGPFFEIWQHLGAVARSISDAEEDCGMEYLRIAVIDALDLFASRRVLLSTALVLCLFTSVPEERKPDEDSTTASGGPAEETMPIVIASPADATEPLLNASDGVAALLHLPAADLIGGSRPSRASESTGSQVSVSQFFFVDVSANFVLECVNAATSFFDQCRLFCTSAAIRKASPIAFAVGAPQIGIVAPTCGTCRGQIGNEFVRYTDGDFDSDSVPLDPSVCSKCKASPLVCLLCEERVRGEFVQLPCGHGGHPHHMDVWISQYGESTCPWC